MYDVCTDFRYIELTIYAQKQTHTQISSTFNGVTGVECNAKCAVYLYIHACEREFLFDHTS